jgi:hypothetical protein
LGVFGKHPGWNDHIEDMLLETDCLAGVKRVLYIEGIGGNIDAGTWDGLVERNRLEEFEHLFVWRTAEGLVIGRLWSSRDGKGRAKYPMAVCAQLPPLPLSWAVAQVLPRLQDIEDRCKLSATSEEVRSIVAEGRTTLAGVLAQSPHDPGLPILPRGVLARIAERDEMRPAHRGLHCLLYQMEREVLPQLDGAGTSRPSLGRPYHIRVPRCADSPGEAVGLWLAFAEAQLSSSVPALLILPDEGRWVDILLGIPSVSQFYCLKANLNAIAMSSEIPYNLDGEFVRRAEERIALSASTGQDGIPLGSGDDKAGGLFKKLSSKLGSWLGNNDKT